MTDDSFACPSGHEPPEGVDIIVPHSARIWNYWLGGNDNYLVDQRAGDEFRDIYPGIVDGARAARYFLARAVRHLAGVAGIRQFLDIGTGLPNADNTHQIARTSSAARSSSLASSTGWNCWSPASFPFRCGGPIPASPRSGGGRPVRWRRPQDLIALDIGPDPSFEARIDRRDHAVIHTSWERPPAAAPIPMPRLSVVILRRSRVSPLPCQSANPPIPAVIMQWFTCHGAFTCPFAVNECMITTGNANGCVKEIEV